MSSPRILGGSARGRPLETPASGTRPSPSRLREALFDILAFEPAPATGTRSLLDLFSGSGAIGLEAASRGWEATCVELSGAAAGVIRRNAVKLGLGVTVVQDDALTYGASRPGEFSVVFAAPPYPLDLGQVFDAVLRSGAAAAGGLYVLQHPTGQEVQVPADVPTDGTRVKKYGTNSLTLVRVSSGAAQGEIPARRTQVPE